MPRVFPYLTGSGQPGTVTQLWAPRPASWAAGRSMHPQSEREAVAAYLPIFIIVAFAFLVAGGMWTLTSLLGPKNPSEEKNLPYESGSDTTGARFIRPSVKFYLTAILFVIFDIEVVFLYPWAIQVRQMGVKALLLMAPFFALLIVGLLFEWKKGALEWEK